MKTPINPVQEWYLIHDKHGPFLQLIVKGKKMTTDLVYLGDSILRINGESLTLPRYKNED
jgi:hypothetical protein